MSVKAEQAYDVLIVGGGVSGCASACFLASDSTFDGKIAVVERDPTYEFSPSAKATGGFRQQFSTPENIRMGLFGAHFVKNVGDYLSVEDEVPDVGFREEGYLLLASADSLPIMSANNALQRENGAETEMLTPQALAQRFPWLNVDGLAGGCTGVRNEGWLDPYALLQAYRKKARSLGVIFIRDTVTEIRRSGSSVSSVRLASGSQLDTGIVINAAGASGLKTLCELVYLPMPVESRKRCTFVFNCREEIGMTPLTILPEGCAFRPEGANFIVNLAPTPDMDPNTDDTDIDHYLFEERIWPILAEHIPAFEAIKTTSAYCCHYDVNTLDGNLIIDRHPAVDNFYFAGGFSGHGLQQSPAVGRAISELVVHGAFKTLDLSRFGYQRIAARRGIFETNCF
jgi:FAD-dependent oxidoreductase domain-containing protein 1